VDTFVLRLWLPDRPGALGAVASRIGAVRGDVVGVEILERGAGRAVDELVVQLPSADLVSLLVAEIAQVDGVDVEDVRPAPRPMVDAGVAALETAARLVGAESFEALLDALGEAACHGFAAEWAAAIDLDGGLLVSTQGVPPPPAWLAAFVAGSRSSLDVAAGHCGAEDVAWALLGSQDCDGDTRPLALVMGRQGRPFRSRERQQLSALCHIAALQRLVLHRRSRASALR